MPELKRTLLPCGLWFPNKCAVTFLSVVSCIAYASSQGRQKEEKDLQCIGRLLQRLQGDLFLLGLARTV